eukprot:9194267-Pyramimonas_sp.AAC.1
MVLLRQGDLGAKDLPRQRVLQRPARRDVGGRDEALDQLAAFLDRWGQKFAGLLIVGSRRA